MRPWRGYYNSAMEGIRLLCHPLARTDSGRVSNEMVHEIDLFPTIARRRA
jgi:hypothetical protein